MSSSSEHKAPPAPSAAMAVGGEAGVDDARTPDATVQVLPGLELATAIEVQLPAAMTEAAGASAGHVVAVLDCSGSMGWNEREAKLKAVMRGVADSGAAEAGVVQWRQFNHSWSALPHGLDSYAVSGGTKLDAMVQATLDGLRGVPTSTPTTIIWVTDGEAADYPTARANWTGGTTGRDMQVIIIGIDAAARERDLVGIAGRVDLYRSVNDVTAATAAAQDIADMLQTMRGTVRVSMGDAEVQVDAKFSEGSARLSVPADMAALIASAATAAGITAGAGASGAGAASAAAGGGDESGGASGGGADSLSDAAAAAAAAGSLGVSVTVTLAASKRKASRGWFGLGGSSKEDPAAAAGGAVLPARVRVQVMTTLAGCISAAGALHARVQALLQRVYKAKTGLAGATMPTMAEVEAVDAAMASVESFTKEDQALRTEAAWDAELEAIAAAARAGDADAARRLTRAARARRKAKANKEFGGVMTALRTDLGNVRRAVKGERVDAGVLREMLQAATTTMGHRSANQQSRMALRAAEQHVGADEQVDRAISKAAQAAATAAAAEDDGSSGGGRAASATLGGECWISGATEAEMLEDGDGDGMVFLGRRAWYNAAQVGTDRWRACPAHAIVHVCPDPVSAQTAIEMLRRDVGISRDTTGRAVNAIVGVCGASVGGGAASGGSDSEGVTPAVVAATRARGARMAPYLQPAASLLAAGRFGFDATAAQEYIAMLAPIASVMGAARTKSTEATAVRMATGLASVALHRNVQSPSLPTGDPANGASYTPLIEHWRSVVEAFVSDPAFQTTAVVYDPRAVVAMALVAHSDCTAAPARPMQRDLFLAPLLRFVLRGYFERAVGDGGDVEAAALRLLALGDASAAPHELRMDDTTALAVREEGSSASASGPAASSAAVPSVRAMAAPPVPGPVVTGPVKTAVDTSVEGSSAPTATSDAEDDSDGGDEGDADGAGAAAGASVGAAASAAAGAGAAGLRLPRAPVPLLSEGELPKPAVTFPALKDHAKLDSSLARLLGHMLPRATCLWMARSAAVLSARGVVSASSNVDAAALQAQIEAPGARRRPLETAVRLVQLLLDEADAAKAAVTLRAAALVALQLRYNGPFRTAAPTLGPDAVALATARDKVARKITNARKDAEATRQASVRAALHRVRLLLVNDPFPLVLTPRLAKQLGVKLSRVPGGKLRPGERPEDVPVDLVTGMARDTWLCEYDPRFLEHADAATYAGEVWGGGDDRSSSGWTPDVHRKCQVTWKHGGPSGDGWRMHEFVEAVFDKVSADVPTRFHENVRGGLSDTWIQFMVHDAINERVRTHKPVGTAEANAAIADGVVARSGVAARDRALELAGAFASADGLREFRLKRAAVPPTCHLDAYMARVRSDVLPTLPPKIFATEDVTPAAAAAAAKAEAEANALQVWVKGCRADMVAKSKLAGATPMRLPGMLAALAEAAGGEATEAQIVAASQAADGDVAEIAGAASGAGAGGSSSA